MRYLLIIALLFHLPSKAQVYYSISPTTYCCYGLSTDTKPVSPPNNCYFTEINTGKTFKSASGSWSLVSIGVDSIAIRLAFVTDSLATALATFTQSRLNDTANAIRTTVNGKQAAGTYAAGTGSASGTNTGDNATNTQYSGLVTNANHTGDATGSTALTFATVNSNVGSFTNANLTVNAKGLITAASNGSTGGGPTFINLASLFSSTSTTPAAVTGWSFAVTTGKTYRITVIADYQTAATTTGGILGITLTTATGTVRGSARGTVVNTAAATELTIPIRATTGAGSTLTTTGVTAASSPHFIGLDITFTCTNTGTFNIVWGTEVNASAAQLNANSSLIYQLLN